MGLKYKLTKNQNKLVMDIDAYWHISEISYTINAAAFALCAYPSRECALAEGQPITDVLVVGSPNTPFGCELYRWQTVVDISEIFPEGIPLGRDAQLTAIYNWIKGYTKIPFEDVLEDDTEE